MRIFEKDEKVNFVDKNNVLIGYDLSQDCCEKAGWFISIDRQTKVQEHLEGKDIIDDTPIDLQDWDIDPSFFEEVSDVDWEGCDDGGGMVRFRLTDGTDECFLHLYNVHNGYYGHSFTVEIKGTQIRENGL